MLDAPLPFAAPAPSRRRTGLLAAGILLVLAPFLYVNPIEIGGNSLSAMRVVAWPWERLSSAPLAHAVEVTALFALGLLAILAGLGAGGRRLLLVVVTVGVFYAIRLHGTDDAYRLAAVESFGLSGYLSMLTLFTGCLLLRAPTASGRALGRQAVVVGAVLSAVLAVACFSKSPPVLDVSLVDEFFRQLPARLDAILGRGSDAPEVRERIVATEVFGKAIPEVFYAVAVVLGLLATLRSRADQPARGRRPALFALVSLLLVWAAPWGWGIGTAVAESIRHEVGSPFQPPVSITAQTVMEAGFGLFLLVASAFARLAGAGTPPEVDVPTPGGFPEGVPFRRVVFGAALVLGLLTLWAAFRPEVGLFARERAWTILGQGLAWDRSVAALVAVTLGAFLATVGLVRVREGAGVAVATGALAVAFVSEHTLKMLSNSPSATYLGVTAYVPFALAAVVAGLAGSRGRGARTFRTVAAVLLLALVLEPHVTIDPKTSQGMPGGEYSSLLTLGATESRSVSDYLFGFVANHGCPAVVAWLALLSILAWVGSSAGRGAGPVRGVRALFGIAMLWPLVQIAAVQPPLSRFEVASSAIPNPVERAVALAVFAFFGPALLLAGALARRRPPAPLAP